MQDLARMLFQAPALHMAWDTHRNSPWDPIEADAELILMMLRNQANHCFAMLLSAVEAAGVPGISVQQLMLAADCMEEGILSAAVQSKCLQTVETVR